jgi:dihydropteroate synthase
MGILNLSPDSFAEARPLDQHQAVDVALRMEEQGADIIDIGGESTRPGADPVTAAEEWARLAPVLDEVVARVKVPVSVDTYKGAVASLALGAGVSLVNDVSGLRHDPTMATVVAEAKGALVLMHSRGRSKTMYAESDYGDVLNDVASELRTGVSAALAGGLSLEQLIVDPGIGFAKRSPHSYVVLAGVSALAAMLERPVLVGPSRKSFMGEALRDRRPSERDWGTAAAVTAAVLGGAHIVRVHAVREMVDVVRVAEAIRRAALSQADRPPFDRGASRDLG